MIKRELNSQYFDQNATVSKLLFLAIMAIALCSFGPLGVFAPVPLAIGYLLYGRLITVATAFISAGILWSLTMSVKGFPAYVAEMYVMAFIFSTFVAEMIKRNINPVKGLITSGLVIVILIGSTLIAFDRLSTSSLRGEISKSVSVVISQLKKQKAESPEVVGEEARAIEDFINKPEVLINDIYSSLPLIVFVFSYFGLWISLYVTLRNSIVWRYKNSYKYNLIDLTHFKVPEFFVYPLILSLVLLLGADYGLPKGSDLIGHNLLYCLGVFYLFQGFGVYNDFLKFVKIGGFVKTLFIAFTLLFAAKFLALLGIFDLWFDFRKFFINRKKDEGDII